MDVHFRDEGNKPTRFPSYLFMAQHLVCIFDIWTDSLKKTNRVIRMDLPAYGLTGPS
jgi:hypothetical protein